MFDIEMPSDEVLSLLTPLKEALKVKHSINCRGACKLTNSLDNNLRSFSKPRQKHTKILQVKLLFFEHLFRTGN